MNAIGNLLWIIFGGFIIFLMYLFGSLILFITIIGIPFGVQTMKLALLSLMPFGKDVRPGERAGGCLYIIMNIKINKLCGNTIRVAAFCTDNPAYFLKK